MRPVLVPTTVSLLGLVLLASLIPLASAVTQSTNNSAAGYQITGPSGSISRVKGSWIVPRLNCATAPNSVSNSSVVLDGINGAGDGAYIGTFANCVRGTPVYGVWVKFFPSTEVTESPSISIHAGDVIEAQEKWSPQTEGFHAQIIDETTQVTSTADSKGPANFTPHLTSGAFLVQRGASQPLANFGSIGFGADNTAVTETCILTATMERSTLDVVTIGALAAEPGFTLVQITMVATSTGHTLASPSALSSDGTSFTVDWARSG